MNLDHAAARCSREDSARFVTAAGRLDIRSDSDSVSFAQCFGSCGIWVVGWTLRVAFGGRGCIGMFGLPHHSHLLMFDSYPLYYAVPAAPVDCSCTRDFAECVEDPLAALVDCPHRLAGGMGRGYSRLAQ